MQWKCWIFVCALMIPGALLANTPPGPVKDSTEQSFDNWFNLDPIEDHMLGISTEKAYRAFLKNRQSTTITVAVIDSGIDIDHEDLDEKIWVNEDEIAGNGIDDDQNGYVDDVHGWNFIGGKGGDNVNHDTYELTRLYVNLSEKYKEKDPESLSKQEKKEYDFYLGIKEKYETEVSEIQEQYTWFTTLYAMYEKANTLMEAYFEVEEVPLDSLENLDSPDAKITQAARILSYAYENDLNETYFEEGEEYFRTSLEYGYNPDFNPRTIVGDDYENVLEKYYGNNDVKGPFSRHGTHVAGIIAADRNNELGIKGIANNAKIMVLRAVPDGDERDKDIANAIYYAVDNGAKIINMSFGKAYSPHKEAVDAAVKYAETRGVLIVHAAGNDSENIDEEDNYPSRQYIDSKKKAQNWIEVGASSWKENAELTAKFSNYGKKTVDVFAPGVEIYSTTPDQSYESLDGTSMAAPVVTGLAAMLMSYYPDLSAVQIKDIILQSVITFDKLQVYQPGSMKLTDFSDLSSTGGIVNAYEAVKLAETMSTGKK